MRNDRVPIRYPLLAALLGVVLVLVGAWIHGFDFDERGLNALIVYGLSLWAAMTASLLGVLLYLPSRKD